MISDKALARAVERRLLTADQADGLRAIEREVVVPPPADDETLRFVAGFADIFVSIGVVLFLGALAFIMDRGAGSTPAYAGLAACAWLLAEFFTFKRRMALPSILLLVVFVGAVFVVALQVFTAVLPAGGTLPDNLWFVPTPAVAPLACAATLAAVLAAMHYLRFRVPVTIAAGTGALCLFAVALVAGLVPGLDETGLNATLFAAGLAVFALAMRFDMSDPERVTRRTDIAFWLHLLAAPLIVHPLVRLFLHGRDGGLTPGAAAGILWIFLGLGAVAVVVDRRAILVSGLLYAGLALWTLMRPLGLGNASLVLAGVLLALGAFILLLSAGWQPLRRAILRRLPDVLARRLPHPLVPSQT